jgi:hypothetical protein
MADVYYAIIEDGAASDWWDGTIAWAYDATDADRQNPAAHANQGARDAQYGGVFQSCTAWEVDRDGNSSGGNGEYGIIMGEWGNDDTTLFAFQSWNADSAHIRAIGLSRACHNQNSYEDGANAAHRLVDSGITYLIRLIDPVTISLDGMQFHNTVADDSFSSILYSTAAITSFNMSNCLMQSADTGGSGIVLNNANISGNIWNCVCYNPHGQVGNGIWLDSVDDFNCYNNIIYGYSIGIHIDAVAGTVNLKNNALGNNNDDINDAVGVTIDYNISDDGDGTNTQNPSGGNWANEFTTPGTDFSLLVGGNCVGNGVDNPGSGLYSDDIKGGARTSTWDCGAFEHIAVGGSAPTGALDGPLGGCLAGPI